MGENKKQGMRFSLKNWIIFGCFLPLWLLTLATGGWLLNTHFKALDEQLLERGQLMLKNLSSRLALSLNKLESLNDVKFLAEQLLENQDVRAFSLYDSSQISLLHAGPSMRPLQFYPNLRWQLQAQVAKEEETLRFVQPIFELLSHERDLSRQRLLGSQQLLGWAELELSLTPLLLYKYRLALLSGGLITGLFLLSLLLTHYLVSYLQMHLEQARTLLLAVAEGKYTHATLSSYSSTYRYSSVLELERLQESLVAMTKQLAERDESYQQSIDEVHEDSLRSLETIEIKNIELDQARKDALQASRIKSEFLANMSHEIRTPLNGIVGFSNLLSRTSMDQRQKEYINHILSTSETMLGIINDILDFSKIEAGMMVLEEMPLDLRQHLDDCLSMFAPISHRQNISLLGIVYDDVPLKVSIDPLRLKQLITNLLSNALKCTLKGDVVLRIMLDDRDDLTDSAALIAPQSGQVSYIKFAVTDTGVGLSENQRQKLFRAFTQADTTQTRQFGGTGLGLAICKQLVQQMGGLIDLESVEGEGSTFWFSLPLMVLNAAPEATPWLVGQTFGVLESHRLTNQAWSHQLRRWGAQVESWDSPEKMPDKLCLKDVTAVLVGMDAWQVKEKSWLDCLSQLRVAKLPNMLLVNTSEPDTHTFLRRQSAGQLLTKPLAMPRLKQALQGLLDPSTVRQTSKTLLPKTKPAVILAVDDTPSNLLLLVTLLEQMGFETLQAINGEQAVHCVAEHPIDLIMMDIQMPVISGIEATKKIRALGHQYRTLPIIACTAHAAVEERSSWLQAGINDILIKPINEKLLTDLLHRWLGERFTLELTSAPLLNVNHSEESWQSCPVDHEMGVKLAIGKAAVADELLSLLLDSLNESRDAIELALKNQNDPALLDAVHRLHGASRYCGVPDLAQTTEALETQLKSGQQQRVASSLEQLFYEIDRLQDWYDRDYTPDWHQQRAFS
ncbi:MAG TPA: response regulator [Marinospirillum sp.]|uniref:response regulator n=1 Tax=Marinospirillum sp. TaxID=2183934 RepID=UPI002B4996C8|nr:response regulator [Marinospirillum sp.]HKM15501.1 response regulator [Marinospirillum sp.]